MKAAATPITPRMPTDALARLRDVMLETRDYGFDKVRAEQVELGRKVRALLESRGFPSVAAEGFKAPGVVVSYTTDPEHPVQQQVRRRRPADRRRRAAAVRRRRGLHELPHRPVRAGEAAPRRPHRPAPSRTR